VVDFIGLPNFPVFNIADMSITVSAIGMVVLAWRGVPLATDDEATSEAPDDDPRDEGASVPEAGR
jgi:signal peptidase II